MVDEFLRFQWICGSCSRVLEVGKRELVKDMVHLHLKTCHVVPTKLHARRISVLSEPRGEPFPEGCRNFKPVPLPPPSPKSGHAFSKIFSAMSSLSVCKGVHRYRQCKRGQYAVY